DWIVMKSLEKDRSRRYETANGLAADVHRYLDDEAVQACPPSAGDRFHKFARKNKVALTTVGLVAAALLIGTGVSLWQSIRATQAERDAVGKQHAAELAEQAEAEQRKLTQRERDVVKSAHENLRQTLYVADMTVAKHAWDEGAIEL